MRNILYYLAVFLVALWAIGFLVFKIGEIIHFLLVLAVIVLILKILQKPKPTAKPTA